MPDTYVQMPDNSYIQFPEGTPDDVINRVAQEHATGISTKSKPAPPAAVPSSQQFDPKLVQTESDRWFKAYKPDSEKQLTVPAQAAYDLAHDKNGPLWTDRLSKMAPITQHVVGRKVDELRMQDARDKYFNTLNQDANEPMKLARALAKSPNNPKLLTQLSQYKDPYVKRVVAEKAQEFADAPVEDKRVINPYGPGPVWPVFHDPNTGKRVDAPQHSQVLAEAIHGPEGAKKLQTAPGAVSEAERIALGMMDPQQAAFVGAMALMNSNPITGAIADTAAAGYMGKQGYDKAKQGDYGGAAVDVALAGLAASGAKGRIKGIKEAKATAAGERAAKLATPAEPTPEPPKPNPATDTASVIRMSEQVAEKKNPAAPESALTKEQKAKLVAERKAESQRMADQTAQRQAADAARVKAGAESLAARKAAAAAQPVQLSAEAEARASRSSKARIIEERKARAAQTAALDADYERYLKDRASKRLSQFPAVEYLDTENQSTQQAGRPVGAAKAEAAQKQAEAQSVAQARAQADADYAAWTQQEPKQAQGPINLPGKQSAPVVEAPASVSANTEPTAATPEPTTPSAPIVQVEDPVPVRAAEPVANSAPSQAESPAESAPEPVKPTGKPTTAAQRAKRGAIDFGPGAPGSPQQKFNDWFNSGVQALKDGKIKLPDFQAALLAKHPELKNAPEMIKPLYIAAKKQGNTTASVATGATAAAQASKAQTDPLVQKVQEGIKAANKVQPEKLTGYSTEKTKRNAMYLEALKGVTDRAGEREARGTLSGPLPQPDFERVEVTPAERDTLHQKITTHPPWRYGNKGYNIAAAHDALDKIMDHGMVPGPYELGLLRDVFGPDFVDALKSKKKPAHWTDMILGWQRFSILSGMATLGKLTTAAAERTAITPAEELLGVGISKIPGMGKVAANAPRQGGFNPQAEAEALRAFFGKVMNDSADPGVVADIQSKLKTGNSSLDKRFGTESETHPFLDFFTRLHGALKLPAQRAEFYRSLTKRTDFAVRMGEDIRDPEVQVRLGAEAYTDSERAIFMQDNLLVERWQDFLNGLDSGSAGGKAMKVAGKILLPIVRVPTNYAGEVGEGVLGVPMAMLKVIKSKGNLTPMEADAVIRWSKKGSIGMGMFALGYMHPEWLQGEGNYVPGESPHRDKNFNEIKFMGYTVPGWATHHPAFQLFQMGATAHRVSTKIGKPENRDIGEQFRQVAVGTLLELPFMEEARTIGMATDTKRGYQKAVGAIGRSVLEPIIMQQIAAIRDNNKRRKPASIKDEMKVGVPGLREQVPASQYQQQRFQP